MSLRSRKRRHWRRKVAREVLTHLSPAADGITRVYVSPCSTEEARLVQGMLDAPAPPAGPFTVTPYDGDPPPPPRPLGIPDPMREDWYKRNP